MLPPRAATLHNRAMTLGEPSPGSTGRHLIRATDRATLATALPAPEGNWPYASLVLVATDYDASPLLLISTLAEHTKNLKLDPHASLLFDGTEGLDDPLTGARVTVLGTLLADSDPVRLRRFVSRHPSASLYAGFKDFCVYRLQVTRAHLVAGFGRIHWIDTGALLGPAADVSWLREHEPSILEHMNSDHGATIDLCAQNLLHRSGSGWRLTGVDREGADLRRGGVVARLDFPAPVNDLDAVRQNFVALAQLAKRGAMSQ